MAQWIGNKLLHDATGCCIEKKNPGRSDTLEMPEPSTAQNYTCTNHDCFIIVYRNGKVLSTGNIACPACGVNGVLMKAKKKRKPKKEKETMLVEVPPGGPGACTCNNAEHDLLSEVCPLNKDDPTMSEDECPVCGAGEGVPCPDGIECSAGV